VKDNARLKKVENRWRKCFHYGPNTLETDTTADPSSNHKLVISGKNERICTPTSEDEGSYIMMLESVWHQLKLRFHFPTFRLKCCTTFILLPPNFILMVRDSSKPLRSFAGSMAGNVPRPCSHTFLVPIVV
jgi:hypothetical protein